MSVKTRILIVEHDTSDLELLHYELKKGEINYVSETVQNEHDYCYALKNFNPDIILSDYSLPSFDGPTAFKMREQLAPQTPFIFVSGNIGEENSIEFIKNGVTDYALKDKLFTLTTKVKRALKESREKQQKNRTEQELIQSERRLARAQQIAHMGSWELDCATNIVLWSNELCSIYGMPLDQNRQSFETWLSFVHQDDLSFVLEKIKGFKDTIKKVSFNHRIVQRNGSIRYIYSESKYEFNSNGQPSVLYGIAHDVTDIKFAEAEMEFNRNNLASLINSTNEAMWSVDRNLNLITSNLTFVRLVKLISGKAIAKGSPVLLKEFQEEKVSDYKKYYERAFAGETFTVIEYDNSVVEFWSEISFYPIRTGDEVIGTACSSRDISERMKAEENLKQSESRLNEAEVIAHIGNWEINVVENTQIWSNEMYKIFGIDKSNCTPSTELYLSFIHPDDFSYASGKLKSAFKSFQNSSFDFRFSRKDIGLRYGYTEWRFGFDKEQNPIRIFGIIQDVTERKQAEIERIKMVSDLEQRNKDLEQFAYIVSHNLRAPVANILGAASGLKYPGLSAEQKDMLSQGINESVTKLDNVVKDLNYVLQVKGSINEVKEKVLLSELVDDIKISIKNLIDKDNIEIRYNFSEVAELLTLKSYLYSIFYNLISNSIKYRQPLVPGIIEIKSQDFQNKIELTFTDNGMGIDLKKKGDQIFGLYKRFHANVEGKGMGLFMVKTQVETLGGKITVKSEVNNGTEFKIEFEK